MTQQDINVEMNLLDSTIIETEDNHQPKYLQTKPKIQSIRKLNDGLFDALYEKFEEIKSMTISKESMIVIMKELMDLTKQCKINIYLREKAINRIVGLLCFCLKKKHTLEKVVDCLLIILNNINQQHLPSILNSILFNFPEPSDELLPLIQSMISLFTEYNITLDIQKVLIEYLLHHQNTFDMNITQYLVDLLENIVKNLRASI